MTGRAKICLSIGMLGILFHLGSAALGEGKQDSAPKVAPFDSLFSGDLENIKGKRFGGQLFESSRWANGFFCPTDFKVDLDGDFTVGFINGELTQDMKGYFDIGLENVRFRENIALAAWATFCSKRTGAVDWKAKNVAIHVSAELNMQDPDLPTLRSIEIESVVTNEVNIDFQVEIVTLPFPLTSYYITDLTNYGLSKFWASNLAKHANFCLTHWIQKKVDEEPDEAEMVKITKGK